MSTGSRASFDHLDAGPLSSAGDFEAEHVRDLRLVTNSNVVGRITRTSAGFLEIARRRSRSGMAQIDRSGHEPFTRSARWRLLKMQRHVGTERLGGHRRDQGRSRVVAKCGETGNQFSSLFRKQLIPWRFSKRFTVRSRAYETGGQVENVGSNILRPSLSYPLTDTSQFDIL
jgi:hypothetical protein